LFSCREGLTLQALTLSVSTSVRPSLLRVFSTFTPQESLVKKRGQRTGGRYISMSMLSGYLDRYVQQMMNYLNVHLEDFQVQVVQDVEANYVPLLRAKSLRLESLGKIPTSALPDSMASEVGWIKSG
jgi:hypothetical protein